MGLSTESRTRASAAVWALLLLAPAGPAPAAGPDTKVVYGEDDRLDYYEASPIRRLAADSTVAVVYSDDLSTFDGGQTYDLSTRLYRTANNGTGYPLCPEEPFYNQRVGAFCSGFMIGPDLIATAGHCIFGGPGAACGDVSFVFGFRMEDASTARRTFPPEDVYECLEVVDGEDSGGPDFSDWLVVRTDRPIAGHEAVPVRGSALGFVPLLTDLMVIGHPSGLPVKIAGGAYVQNNDFDAFFAANLDTYAGNSGSAVFNRASVEAGLPLVEGILVRGADDFVKASGRNCAISNVCPDVVGGCGDADGEESSRAAEIEAAMPAPPARGLLSLLLFLGAVPDDYDKNGDFSTDLGDVVVALREQAGLP